MIDPVAFYLGPLAIRWYGIIMSLAVLIGISLTLKEARRQGMNPEFFLDFFIYGIPGAVIGARLYYVVFRWEYYQNNLRAIINTRQGGLAIHGAVIAGLLILFLLSRKRAISFWRSVDIMVPGLVLGQAIGRWGNFINQEAHGGIASSEFMRFFPEFIQRQMLINGKYYHPTFLYESLWDLMIFLFLIYIRRNDFIKKGDIFLGYLIGYSLGRFFIEGLRTDSLMLGPIRIAQLISLLAIIVGITLLYFRHRKEQV